MLFSLQGSQKKTLKSVLAKFGYGDVQSQLKECPNPRLQEDLLTLEKQERAMNLKFGVIYAKAGQKTDDEFLSNPEGSQAFHNFLDLLGTR